MPVTIGAVTGGIQSVIGIAQKIKAAKLAKSNIRPDLTDSTYLDDSYKLNEAYAGEGLDENSKQAYIQNNDRNLSSSLDTMLRLGGGPNLVSQLYDTSTNALQGLALADETARVRNRANFVASQKDKSSEQRDEFFLNKYQPWKDQNALINQLSNEGMQNIWKGVNTAGSAVVGSLNPYGNKSNTSTTAPALEGGSIATNDLSKYFTPMKLQKMSLGPLAKVPPSGNGNQVFDPTNIFAGDYD